MPYTRPPFIGPNQQMDPNDAEAAEAEAQRNRSRADLELLIRAIQESQSEYDEDIVTFNCALPMIDAQSPIVAEAIDRLTVTLSDKTYDDNYNDVILVARNIFNKI
ncbi:MAG: hypothetical protein J6U54_22835 [Clostridiales bacterium]|nr:hypothetical protein [Clostridiales bacterium]